MAGIHSQRLQLKSETKTKKNEKWQDDRLYFVMREYTSLVSSETARGFSGKRQRKTAAPTVTLPG
jgi:hypothetical protein